MLKTFMIEIAMLVLCGARITCCRN